jgi:hypothetical protein
MTRWTAIGNTHVTASATERAMQGAVSVFFHAFLAFLDISKARASGAACDASAATSRSRLCNRAVRSCGLH